jgi:hypothetical protein
MDSEDNERLKRMNLDRSCSMEVVEENVSARDIVLDVGVASSDSSSFSLICSKSDERRCRDCKILSELRINWC